MKYEIIDSHCHLDFPKFNRDRRESIERARNSGVVEMINSGMDYKTNLSTLSLSDEYDFIHPTLGLGPQVVIHSDDIQVEHILDQIEQNIHRAVGIGEAGMDYYHCKSIPGQMRQVEVFKKIIDIAQSHDKTLVIHGREAEDKALKLVQNLDMVVFHCYGGSVKTMERIVDAGYYVSIATLVCFSEHHQILAEKLPLENMLLETDSPYLSPRKGRNEPAFIVDSLEKIAQIKEIEKQEVAKATTKNTRRAFRI